MAASRKLNTIHQIFYQLILRSEEEAHVDSESLQLQLFAQSHLNGSVIFLSLSLPFNSWFTTTPGMLLLSFFMKSGGKYLFRSSANSWFTSINSPDSLSIGHFVNSFQLSPQSLPICFFAASYFSCSNFFSSLIF